MRLECGGLCVSEASGIFLIGLVMCTRAVEHYKAVFQSSPLLYVSEKG